THVVRQTCNRSTEAVQTPAPSPFPPTPFHPLPKHASPPAPPHPPVRRRPGRRDARPGPAGDVPDHARLAGRDASGAGARDGGVARVALSPPTAVASLLLPGHSDDVPRQADPTPACRLSDRSALRAGVTSGTPSECPPRRRRLSRRRRCGSHGKSTRGWPRRRLPAPCGPTSETIPAASPPS